MLDAAEIDQFPFRCGLQSWKEPTKKHMESMMTGYHSGKEKNATGLYYLLREGPALVGRTELFSGGDAAVENDEEKIVR